MYLKSLEMVGFKSFAAKTKLVFEPGMTAIVGPNGCGKSNISDAIRWVLGEQSAKAMRGASMEDCIFNGTDARKPMGMAEVSITFAGCEATLETEYDEVTVTRRVFRSGEGQYLLNKTPCRLKDIQRLFMGTGVGTTSYSFMAQGRIDQILSSRPEDRRVVFEEAAGITKFKADKKEAIRKLEHTEANLLRLADVIREVKRQIGSLQRQAGKARRYKSMKDELRRLDIFTTKQHLSRADADIREMDNRIEHLAARITELHDEVKEAETGSNVIRESLTRTEREIASVAEAGVQAQSRLDHTREVIQMNRQRIEEYETWSQRDSREMADLEAQIADKKNALAELAKTTAGLADEHEQAEQDLKRQNEQVTEVQGEVDATRRMVRQRREELLGAESGMSRLQNQISEIEARERSATIQRERLTAEKSQLTRALEQQEHRLREASDELTRLQQAAEEAAARLAELDERKRKQRTELAHVQNERGTAQSDLAARTAKLDMLRESEAAGEGYAEGSQRLLDPNDRLGVNTDRVLGALAAQLDVDDDYGRALEVALRAWLDAVVVADDAAAREVLRAVQARSAGVTRLVARTAEPAPVPDWPHGADPLLHHVRAADGMQPLLARLIGHVCVVESLDAVPDPLPADRTVVTRAGMLLSGNGAYEFWRPESAVASPLARRQNIAEAEQACAELNRSIETLAARQTNLLETDRALQSEEHELQTDLQARQRSLAQKEGEHQVIERETHQARERLETVTWELDSMQRDGASGTDEKTEAAREIATLRQRRDALGREIENCTESLHSLENRLSELQSVSTESRIRFAGIAQKLEHMQSRYESTESHVRELETALKGRSEGLDSYRESIDRLRGEITAAESRLSELQTAVTETNTKAESLRRNREKQSQELKGIETQLAQRREALDQIHEQKSSLDIKRTEANVRRQNRLDRVTGEYNISYDELLAEAEPEWEGEAPSQETAETRVAELRTKMEAMGPINLVAIEEYKELEERFAFLTEQEQDLVKSKQQLMDMIRKINRTTTEMFSETFERVNENFQTMFKQLFNGGSAKLVLVDEEDVLESGIEIIARPPGKRLQNVSLLSGGERTLTAVALLFSIYQIKPSPFCLLDELDAALDDVNINRFVKVLQGFLQQSQFVVITHNRQTIAAADILYGVTMPEHGVSKLVSMRFRDQQDEAKTAVATSGTPEDAAAGSESAEAALEASRT